MLKILISGFVGMIVGAWLIAMLTAGKIADLERDVAQKEESARLLGEELKKYASKEAQS